jgi:hypothetical protein
MAKQTAQIEKQEITTFRVKTRGYSETFTTVQAATAQYEATKKKLTRRGEGFTVTMEQKVGNSFEVIQQCKVSDDAFDEE